MKPSIETLVRYFTQKGTIILLESQSAEHPWSRKTYLAAAPEATITAQNNKITITEGKETHRFTENPWQALKKFRCRHNNWVFGYLGYDLKNHIEDLYSENEDPISVPDLFFMVPKFLVEFDHKGGNYHVIRGEIPSEEELFYLSGLAISDFEINNISPLISRDNYIDKIKKAQQGIREGDFYEVNLSHQMKGRFNGDSFSLYQRMREVGPVPFGAFMRTDDWSICCQSPERFLRKEGANIFSQPIKGTAQRSSDAGRDQLLKRELIESQKEQAENLMIVDLVRNDLSKIARRGSVKVPKLFEIESFGTVHQMVSTVSAEVGDEDTISILEACFPMGSMTGAPKISAMKAIDDLEDYRRGIYSGAMGYIRPNNEFDFNVVIRTAIVKGKELFYSVGGAITGDSDPYSEWKETLVKARALLEAVGENDITE